MPPRVVLEGAVVRLEPLTAEHVQPLLAAATEDRATYGFTTVPGTAEDMRRYVDLALEQEQVGWALPFAIRHVARDEIVGSTRFLDLEYWQHPAPFSAAVDPATPPDAVEIGSTWLAASAQRTGVNTEMKLLMLTHAFDEWGVQRVTLKTDARNQRSRDAIARIGASFEGVRRAHTYATDGSLRDSAYYSIVASEWPGVRDALVAWTRVSSTSGTTPAGRLRPSTPTSPT